ncbi:MAG: zinc ABC transporter substrate-binding protein [Cellvibrio sp. 79]|nr:MAG: zinc ABC transporter substrate-binding protein [Cellvibrio sp. 79]
MSRVFLAGLIVMLGQCLPLAAMAKPQILASIKPLALIAQEVVGDNAHIETLLPTTASPHDYPLKMSDHRHLRDADLVLWVGPELESFLARSLANIPPAKVMATYDLPDLHWPENTVESDGHQHANHQHTGGDPHLWLDPRNAQVIARALAARMIAIDPQSARVYQANAERFIARIQQLDLQLNQQLAPIKSKGFAVYHEGYSHFVSRYGLHQVGYVTYAPERRPGARHLRELHEVLKQEGKCLFVEPYYQVESIEAMAKAIGLRIGTLDPIGDQQVSSYQQLLEKLGQSFLACLTNLAG